VRRQGVTVEKGSSSFLQVLAFYSPDGRFDDLYTSNYVTLNVLDALKRMPRHHQRADLRRQGLRDAHLAQARPHGAAEGITARRRRRARSTSRTRSSRPARSGQAPTGGAQEMVYTITTQGPPVRGRASSRTSSSAPTPDGTAMRLRDVARVELGAKDYDFKSARINGKPATLVGVFLQPGANALDVGQGCARPWPIWPKRFPEGLTYKVPYDTTRFVEVSIREVLKTLARPWCWCSWWCSCSCRTGAPR
jgi:multidrug efflux pump subunit AcrB